MLPQMGKVLQRFLQPVTIRTVSQEIVDFRPVETEVSLITKAVVQPAQKEKLNPAIIDWSLRYLQVHSTDQMKIGDFITHSGTGYKAVELGDYNDYEYFETIFEEVK